MFGFIGIGGLDLQVCTDILGEPVPVSNGHFKVPRRFQCQPVGGELATIRSGIGENGEASGVVRKQWVLVPEWILIAQQPVLVSVREVDGDEAIASLLAATTHIGSSCGRCSDRRVAPCR